MDLLNIRKKIIFVNSELCIFIISSIPNPKDTEELLKIDSITPNHDMLALSINETILGLLKYKLVTTTPSVKT